MTIGIPHLISPIICNAPMFGTANAALAAAVSSAGGLGFIGGGVVFSEGSPHLPALEAELAAARAAIAPHQDQHATLPVGVGFLTFDKSVADFSRTVIPILRRYRPAAVWLFAADPSWNPHAHAEIIKSLRSASAEESYHLSIFVQVGSVAGAREAVEQGADVIVAQGSDAGGHQWAKNAGLITIVPEIRDMLHKEFPGQKISLFAAGGIADGRGVAAAIALGADGIVMGTRFITSSESAAEPHQRNAVLAASDGGATTAKSTAHDDIMNRPIWPKLYDGRAIIGESYKDFLDGVPLEENIAKYEAASKDDTSRRIVWAGSAVGLINNDLPAGDIVKQVRDQALSIFRTFSGL